MKLYTYYRSSASYRVRIALQLKNIAYTPVPINLMEAEQASEAYLASNPQGLIPALELDNGHIIGQSTAILEYLEEAYPASPLLPADPVARANERSLINLIACDIHPLNNLSVQLYLKEHLGASPEQVSAWYSQWVHRGFNSIEKTAREGSGLYCFDNAPGMADCYLIPQVFNALRFHVDMNPYPAIQSIYQHCNTLDAFQRAHPNRQSDAPA